MSAGLWVRQGGAWVQSSASGRVRLGGVDIPFAPPSGGTVDEWLQMPNPLSSSDWADDNTNVAVRFATTTAGSWIGNRVWVPPTFSARAAVWGTNADTQTVIAASTAMDPGRPLGAFVNTLFSTPVAIVPGVNYLAAFHTDRYGFSRVTDGATIPLLSQTSKLYTDGAAMSAVAFFMFSSPPALGATATFTSSPNFHYNVSPIVRYST